MLLGLMLMLMLASIALLGTAEVWSTARQREQERELLFVGEQYRQAIRHYYFASQPGRPRVFPARLEQLLEDDRFPIPVQHLRRLYPDPITGNNDWGLVVVADRIAGVYSLSDAVPIKQTGFPAGLSAFENQTSYQAWKFVFVPPRSGRR